MPRGRRSRPRLAHLHELERALLRRWRPGDNALLVAERLGLSERRVLQALEHAARCAAAHWRPHRPLAEIAEDAGLPLPFVAYVCAGIRARGRRP